MAGALQLLDPEEEKRQKERLEKEAREKAEKEAADRRSAEEQQAKQIKEDYERQLAEDRVELQKQWAEFQRVKFDAPPALLPLEASVELRAFRAYSTDRMFREPMPAAVASFEAGITSQGQEAERAVERLRRGLQSTSPFAGIFGSMSFGKLSELLRDCVVSVEVPNLGSPAREAVAGSCRLLRKIWSERLGPKQQAIFSIHRCAGKSVIQIGSSLYGSVFITLPRSMEPEALAQAILSEIKKASSRIVTNDCTIAVIDGDYQALNYQRIFDKNVVVRSVKDDCDRFASNLDAFLKREPPTAENTALHLGMPADESELNAVFKKGGADWTLWSDVAPLWQGRASRQGFGAHPSASAEQVINSLVKDKNVIVVVAHGDRRTLYMPAPPPDGSELNADQIIERKAEIAANKPVVYLFCCETAEVSDLKSFSEILLDSGAAAVIAPQTKIDAERSVDFFEGIVRKETGRPENSLTKFKAAARRSNYREMEMWLG